MPIIDSNSSYSKFDALIRTNKADTLMAFIKATFSVQELDDRKQRVAEALKLTYNLFRDNGTGTYGNGDRPLLNQFESHYTMGYEMGIWHDSDLSLNPLAIEVAEYKITVREYIGIVFRNLFTYYEINGISKYHHFLYEVLKAIKTNSLVRGEISKDIIKNTLPIPEATKLNEQTNLLFNYLISTDIFNKVSRSSMVLSTQWRNSFDKLLDECNLEYEGKTEEEAIEMAKNKASYSAYITSKSDTDCNDNNTGNCDVNYYSDETSKYSRNRIIFGAPGTGKSYKLNEDLKGLLVNGGEYERVTFHPDYSYANFVGTYKPVPLKDENNNEIISYKYVPGPFMRVLVKALKSAQTNSAKPYLLIIEEINRSNIASVFGDVFQLLDRDSCGVSEYSIQTSEDLKLYLWNELGGDLDSYSNVRIPNNMYLWATMNSADQGVFPMDTAFKRRWDFTYLGINDNEVGIAEYEVSLKNGARINWNNLRRAINEVLIKEVKVNEDKLIGPYFISKDNLDDSEKFIDTFKNKVIMYLFDDAAKHRRAILFPGCTNYNLFSEICTEFDQKGVLIFSEEVAKKSIISITENPFNLSSKNTVELGIAADKNQGN